MVEYTYAVDCINPTQLHTTLVRFERSFETSIYNKCTYNTNVCMYAQYFTNFNAVSKMYKHICARTYGQSSAALALKVNARFSLTQEYTVTKKTIIL